MDDLIKGVLQYIGEDPNRPGLRLTPERVRKAYEHMTQGYHQDLQTIVEGALFEEQYDEMVILKTTNFFSLCEHHLLPFYGKCHVAYIPDGKIVGLSKIPRIIDMFARRLQVQERLTTQIADTLQQILKPKGVAVVMEAQHLCMIMRGGEKQNTVVTTSAMYGAFRTRQATRDEFIELIPKGV